MRRLRVIQLLGWIVIFTAVCIPLCAQTKERGHATEPIDPKKEPLAYALANNNPNLWPEGTKEYSEYTALIGVTLTNHKVRQYDEKTGEDLGTVIEVPGIKIREAIALRRALLEETGADAEGRPSRLDDNAHAELRRRFNQPPPPPQFRITPEVAQEWKRAKLLLMGYIAELNAETAQNLTGNNNIANLESLLADDLAQNTLTGSNMIRFPVAEVSEISRNAGTPSGDLSLAHVRQGEMNLSAREASASDVSSAMATSGQAPATDNYLCPTLTMIDNTIMLA